MKQISKALSNIDDLEYFGFNPCKCLKNDY